MKALIAKANVGWAPTYIPFTKRKPAFKAGFGKTDL
jgi:hypothetical protein